MKAGYLERVEEKERVKIELIENIEPDRHWGQNKKPEEDEVRLQQAQQPMQQAQPQVQQQVHKPKPFVQTVTPDYLSQLGISN